MPYERAEATKAITVKVVRITLSVRPEPPWTAGQIIELRAVLTRDGVPYAGQTVSFRTVIPLRSIGTAVTDAYGIAVLSWVIPWILGGETLPCTTRTFSAIYGEARSNTVSGKIAYPTKLSISAPEAVTPDELFTVSGKLEYESAIGVFSGLAGRTVSLFYNATKIADVTTESDGGYSTTTHIPTSGTYTLKATFGGEGFGFAPAFAVLGLPVGVPPELEPLIQYATYALAAVPVLAVSGVVAYNELTKKR